MPEAYSMTPTEARSTLHQALDGRAGHAAFVSISSRQISNGVRLLWFDYLSREEGSLLVVDESQLQQTVETLLSELQNWRAAASAHECGTGKFQNQNRPSALSSKS